MFTEIAIEPVLEASEMLVWIEPSLPDVTNKISVVKSIVVEDASEPDSFRSFAASALDST